MILWPGSSSRTSPLQAGQARISKNSLSIITPPRYAIFLSPSRPAAGLLHRPDQLLPGNDDEVVQDPEGGPGRSGGPPPDHILHDLVVLPPDRLHALRIAVGDALHPC